MDKIQKSILLPGVVSALLLFGGFLLVYVAGYDPIANKGMYYWIPVPIIVRAIRVLKDDQFHGEMPFGAGIKHGVLISTVYAVLFALGMYMICKIAEPPFVDEFSELIAEKMEEEKAASSPEISEEQFDGITALFQDNILGFIAFSELISKFIFGAIVTLIASFVFRKREQPVS